MTFPTTPILDNFNRANEGPPPSASWYDDVAYYTGLRVKDNTLQLQTGDGGFSQSFWNDAAIGPDCEIYITVASVIDANSSVLLNIKTPEFHPVFPDTTWTGYQALFAAAGYWILYRMDDVSTYTSIGSGALTISDGDKFGLSAIGSTLTVYQYTGGVWNVLDTITDGTFAANTGYLSVIMTGTIDGGFASDNFGGGTIVSAPVADFSGTPTSGSVALSVDFTDASTNAPTSWFWDFGDGGSSTSQNPTYVYNYVGTYTVTLTATNSAGSDSETKVAYITVTAVAEYGASIIENCDIDTGGLAVGLRVSDVAIARDNRLGSVVIDASAELRVKDNSYTTLTLNGTLTSLAGDRSVWDVANFPAAHASDIDDASYTVHRNPALAATYTVTNPVELRTIDLSSFTLNDLAAIVGTLLSDLGLA